MKTCAMLVLLATAVGSSAANAADADHGGN